MPVLDVVVWEVEAQNVSVFSLPTLSPSLQKAQPVKNPNLARLEVFFRLKVEHSFMFILSVTSLCQRI